MNASFKSAVVATAVTLTPLSAHADSTALLYAIRSQDSEAISSLIQQGAQVSEHALITAIEEYYIDADVKKALADRASQQLSHEKMVNALYKASSYCDANFVEYLIDTGLAPNTRHPNRDIRPKYAFTLALHGASMEHNHASRRNDCLDTVRVFEDKGADFDLVRYESSYGQGAAKTLGLLAEYPDHVFE